MESIRIQNLLSIPEVQFCLRLFASVFCGFLIGLERSLRLKISGVRTNMLVALGSAAFVLVGAQISPEATAQVTAYCITGVGFLGAGIINRDKGSVRGLNTAATLWCVAGVGAQCAAGHYLLASASTAAVLLAHIFVRPLGRSLKVARVSAKNSKGRHRNANDSSKRKRVEP